MTCQAKGCERDTDSDDEQTRLCSVCIVEMEVLMRGELAKRLGREPSGAEFDIFIDRVLARAVGPARRP